MTETLTRAQCPMHRKAVETHKPFNHHGMTEFYREIRADVPIFHSPEIDHWVLTRREDVLAVFQDPQRFSAANAASPLFQWPDKVLKLLAEREVAVVATLINSDGDRHRRFKGVTSKFLNIKRFSSYEPQMRELVRGYIADMKGKKTVDLVDAVTYEFPAQVVFLLYGVTDFDPRKIKSWGDLRTKMIWGDLSDEELERAAVDLADFWDFAVDLVAKRKAHREDDYPSLLLNAMEGADSPVDENEVCNMVFALLLAGHETTTNAAGNLFLELLRHPGQWRKLVARPELIKNTVEEGLRYASSVVAWRRTALEDVEIAGTTIPKGGKLVLSLVSANRDEDHFEDGEVFDIERQNARTHLAFGNGMHHCAGAPLARLELRILLEEMTAAFPNMRLSEGQELKFMRTLSFRGPESLIVHPEG